jgi:23S rRNA G2445 N2-methylase RlmL
MSDRYELFLTCPKGLEGLLLEEASSLGLEEAREHTSAIRGMADMETAYRLCLWSRLANRVLLVLKRYSVQDAQSLYEAYWRSTGSSTWNLTAVWPWNSAAMARASTTPISVR